MFKKALIIASLLVNPVVALAMPKINAQAPDFSLKGHDGKTYKLSDYKDKFVVLEWWNKDCPFVAKHYSSGNMQKLQKEYGDKGVVWFTILSSAPGKQGYLKPDEIKKVMAEQNAKQKVVLIDEDGKVGQMYAAKTTPHMYIINPKGSLIYMGAIDDKPTVKVEDLKSATNYVKEALDLAMQDKAVKHQSTKPYGCSIKYKS